jgi:carbon storage regulator
MLIVTRKPGQALRIGDNIRVVLLEASRSHTRIGVDAPPEVQIDREEEQAQYRVRGNTDDAGEGWAIAPAGG